MEHTRTIAITITVDPHEEMFSVEGLEGESGDRWATSKKNGLSTRMKSSGQCQVPAGMRMMVG